MGRYLTFLLIIAILVATAIVISTPEGLGVFPDSVQYIRTATAINSGRFSLGTTPAETIAELSRFPPLFPVVLALFVKTDGGIHQALRLPFAALGGLNVVLLGLLLYAASKRRLLAASLTVLGVTSLAFIRQHLLLYSEPLFLVVEILMLLLILPTGPWQERRGVPFAAALLGMLASLLRYAGISLSGIGAVCAVIREDTPSWRKVYSAILFAVALLPVGAWIWFLQTSQASVGGRSFHARSLTLESLLHMAAQVGALIPPLSLGTSENLQAIGALILLSVLAAFAARSPLGRATLSGLVVYIGFLLFAHSTVDAAVPFNDRILLPLLPFVLVLASVALSSEKLSEFHRRLLSLLFIVLAFFQIALQVVPVLAASQYGLGFSNGTVAHSPLFPYLKEIPREAAISSNYPEVILLYSGGIARDIPNQVDPGSDQPNAALETDLAALQNELKTSGGILVWFRAFNWRKYQPPEQLVVKALGLEVVKSFDIGTVYRVR